MGGACRVAELRLRLTQRPIYELTPTSTAFPPVPKPPYVPASGTAVVEDRFVGPSKACESAMRSYHRDSTSVIERTNAAILGVTVIPTGDGGSRRKPEFPAVGQTVVASPALDRCRYRLNVSSGRVESLMTTWSGKLDCVDEEQLRQ